MREKYKREEAKEHKNSRFIEKAIYAKVRRRRRQKSLSYRLILIYFCIEKTKREEILQSRKIDKWKLRKKNSC